MPGSKVQGGSYSLGADNTVRPFLQNGRFYLTDRFSLNVYECPTYSLPKGVVFFGHGIVEHSGRYLEWGRYLARHGYYVYAVDHRGHGRSDGRRLWAKKYSVLVDDFCAFVRRGAAGHPGIPVFIAGMSMGGGIAVQATVRLQEELPNFRGAVLVSPGIAVAPKVFPRLRKLAPVFDFLVPWLPIVKPGIGALSASPEIREQFRNDPDVYHGWITVHFGAENLRALAVNQGCAQGIRVPVLICQGDSDRITDPAGAARFFNEMKAGGKAMKVYPGAGHDLLHEDGVGDEASRDIVEWLDARLAENRS